MAKYGAAVACVDWVMGVFMHELKRLGLDENTLIVFTSDNGSRCDHEGSNGSASRGKKDTDVGRRIASSVHHALARRRSPTAGLQRE